MRFQDISEIERLIEQRTREVPALEFKSDAPLDGDAARKKLLRDLTSMGNSGGGTIIFGLEADNLSGVGIAKRITPLHNPAFVSTIENIVRDVVRPPLLWTLTEFESGDGLVVVAEVQPSSLGPYMFQGYGDHRYYRRGEIGVVEMTEYEVSSAYQLARRSTENRDSQWAKHFLPMTTPPDQAWLSIAAMPFEPFLPIFEGSEINSFQIVHPENIGRCLFGLPIHNATVRHWAEGITADDSTAGSPLSFSMRLHRDGAAGIIQKLESFVDLIATARVVNAYLAYLADFWATYALRSPVEIKVAIPGISTVSAAKTWMGASPSGIVQPPDVMVATVDVSEEVLPWDLSRAHVRHALVRQFIERVSYAFNWPYRGELFSYGPLFVRGGAASDLLLGPGLVTRRGSGGSISHVDEAGRVRGSSGYVKSFVVDGAIVDEFGDTLAVVELTDSLACPSDFLSDYSIQVSGVTLAPWNAPTPDQGGPNVPPPTGRWSDKNVNHEIA